ncbi:hypothetical protein M3Y94_01188100 [Aphelenchoides besseyi]|nr:hypothetical protein M3Y94_01188100 [Aphelenchoides besseyi]
MSSTAVKSSTGLRAVITGASSGLGELAFSTFTEDNVELHFAINHLGHFLCREVPTLQTVHAKYKPQLSPKLFYAQSKLANALFTKALTNHIARNAAKLPTIKVFCLRPGFIRGTELGRYHNPYLRWLATPLIYFVAKDINFTNEINDDRKQKLASEFKCQTAFPQPIDTDDFLTAKRFKLDVFTENEKLPVCESATLSVVHVLHHSKNPNEEFEFETTIGDVKGRVEKHDFSTLVFPSIEIFSLDSHKQQLTEKLPTIADPKFGKQIADLLPPGVMVNQIVYAPKLKYLLIALDQATSHEQFMSLKLPRDQLLLIDPEGTSVRAVIVTFHYIPNSRSEEVQSVHQLLPLISEPDYVVRVFDWNQSDDYSSSGAAQLVAAPFWSAVYNRTNNLKGTFDFTSDYV